MPFSTSMGAIGAAIRAAAAPGGRLSQPGVRVGGVVTVSRQAGIDVTPIVLELVRLLNESGPGGWLAYDRELVERVARDHQLSEELVAMFSERDRNWLADFAAHLPGSDASLVDVARRVAQTIRGLSRVGRAVIVGRGSQCTLGEVARARHVRLIAPRQWRVARSAESEELNPDEALDRVRRTDTERARFIRNRFQCGVDEPDLYHMVLNVARVTPHLAAHLIAGLVPNEDR